MADISKEQLEKEIAIILKDANLATTSAKKVRQELEKVLEVDLSARRKEIDQLVMDYVNSKDEGSDEEEEEEDESEEDKKPIKRPAPASKKPAKKAKKSSEEEDGSAADSEEEEKPKKAAPKKKSGKKKKKGSESDSDSDWGKREKKEKAKKAGGRGKGGGYTRAYKLSPALAELMGEDSMARHEVVKRVWAIIKEKKLYDPSNKQFAICDDALLKVFGTKRFRTFGMMKYLKTHFYE